MVKKRYEIYRDMEHFYNQIPPTIEKSLTFEQKESFRKVLDKAVYKPSKKMVDIETTFWLFKHLYIVIYVGEDLRRKGRKFTNNHKMEALSVVTKVIIYLLELSLLLVLLFFVLYFVKSTLGINIFEEKHLLDFLR